MTSFPRRTIAALVPALLAVGLVSTAPRAAAGTYPERTVTVVLPFIPNGSMQFQLQTVLPRIEAELGQKFPIVNMPGRTGNLGAAYIAKATPDGYTIGFTAVNIGVFPHLYANMGYDPLTAFTPIGQVSETPGVCVVGAGSKIRTFAELIAEARAHPGKLRFGSAGVGAPSHLIVEKIGRINGVSFVHDVQNHAIYSIAGVSEGGIDFSCDGLAGTLASIRSGKVRPLAVTSATRSPALPEVPTINEAGFGPLDETSRYILVAPAGTPASDIERLTAALDHALDDPAVTKTFRDAGLGIRHLSAAEILRMLREQYDRWGPFIRSIGLKAQ